ncbi:hypothetical protein CA13_55780 [Planctomycetes bacterium CA13]|uniref:Heparinase II N-terminal domain-containing protein n=2 Tax=Novipirellula herctigrandis TaxID=2527986 RepID=A0A5C5Z9U9_9BACT|nr:hypothetical protein CA13_55780 [Planctomycetes bacterium CA13]
MVAIHYIIGFPPKAYPGEKTPAIAKLPMRFLLLCYLSLICTAGLAADLKLDQRPAQPSEWGYRPPDKSNSEVNPPNFSWRPQRGITQWEIQCAADSNFSTINYQADSIQYSVHTPSVAFPAGNCFWRYRGQNERGEFTQWSDVRRVSIAADALVMPMPSRDELVSRIPEQHPRLFLRPEDVPRLRQLAAGSMQTHFNSLVGTCEKLLRNPPPTKEPSKYGPNVDKKSEPWREIWWGNRNYTIRALDGAATLAFTRLIGGKDEYGALAKRILLECAKWDPKGATGYRYNDEAGMPYAYYFSRTYTFVNDLLSEDEKEICRKVMKIRGDEIFEHLSPRHLWSPYASHSNRAWHFLGEIGLAFHGEIEQADQWVWFATNVFFHSYPVWHGHRIKS